MRACGCQRLLGYIDREKRRADRHRQTSHTHTHRYAHAHTHTHTHRAQRGADLCSPDAVACVDAVNVLLRNLRRWWWWWWWWRERGNGEQGGKEGRKERKEGRKEGRNKERKERRKDRIHTWRTVLRL